MLRRVRAGYQLLARNGCLYAGSGETFDDQSEAALACPNIESVSTIEPTAPVEAPKVEAEAPKLSQKPRAHFGRSFKAIDDNDPVTEGGVTP